jgi:hypothetical protein
LTVLRTCTATGFVTSPIACYLRNDHARALALRMYYRFLMQINDIRLVMGDDERA